MPELPEVETIARGLAPEIVGRTIESVDVRYANATRMGADEFARRVTGCRVIAVRRRGKMLLVDLASATPSKAAASPETTDITADMHLAVHLKMTGRLWVPPCGDPALTAPDKHTHILFSLSGGCAMQFKDVRKFGWCRAMTDAELAELDFLCTLGPEPLEMSVEDFVIAFKARSGAIKGVLLNQKIIAGIGNIYADESLFRAGIAPHTKASQVSRKRLAELHRHLREVLLQAISENGSSISDYRNAHGDSGAFQNRFNVYGKGGEPCPRCKTKLAVRKVAGRTSTYCPSCQR
ncbi:MAG: bifunctional DNA-formamidopyrimidine glycosylase/DNA-(apurinic or apyrimidinic site) lyase [Desulfovibrio sp.]|uniref:bifunctional DNA-formamidopyrimidine glycosylase/DNA-(apurinic or apyrimidinic site) lyase n=1 Tax=Desulfovibrio sp. 7SRBS1 TaxID=3378064 RepID=UPI003B3FB925